MGTPQATGADRPGNRVARAAKLAGLVALVAVLATGCSTEEVLRFGWPEGITPQADRMRVFWTWSVVAALVIGVITWALILWPVVAHRKRGDKLPKQFQYNHFLEIIYTGIPVVIVVVLFYFTATTQSYVQAETDDPDVVVDVVAFQWNWEFDYVSYKNASGAEQEPKAPGDETVRTIGSSAEIPLLVLPNDRVIEYRLRATDVIHSFFVPDFLFKRDVFPHPKKNNQDDTFQNRIDKTGSFVGRCAELCGTYHAVMNFEVRVVTPEIFDRYMDLRTKVNPATGRGYTAAEALTELNCGELCTPHAVTTSPFNTDRTARSASGS
ncbi:cytochrome c oxidase subunit II [Actinokineospora soli]|uniref:cytochrome-c oxidase n=1 Tax=Actinokineospora soli TaxID=1048753 RepID=A0ABW2TLN8_9PSEU